MSFDLLLAIFWDLKVFKKFKKISYIFFRAIQTGTTFLRIWSFRELPKTKAKNTWFAHFSFKLFARKIFAKSLRGGFMSKWYCLLPWYFWEIENKWIPLQILKKQSINMSRYNEARWRSAASGGHYNAIPGSGAPSTGQRTKSTMMFRQFSGDRKSKALPSGSKI